MSAVAPIRPGTPHEAGTPAVAAGPWVQDWLAEIPGLAPAVSRLLGESREATARSLHQTAAAVLARIACMAQRPAGGSRLRGMLRLPGADASVMPDLPMVLDDERESETLMKAGAEALGGLFGAHRIAPLASALGTDAGFRHRASGAHVLELVAAIALARVNVLAREHSLDTAALMRTLGEARRQAWMSMAPAIAETIGDEREEPWCDRPEGSSEPVAFRPPPSPSIASRLLAWAVLAAAIAGLAGVVFVL